MAGQNILGADLGVTVSAQGIHETSTTAKYRLGERWQIGDRVFRYARAGASLEGTSVCIQGLFNNSKPYEGDRPATAYPVGATEIVVTALSTGNAVTYGTKDMYAGGYIWFQMAPHMLHKIKSNTASDGTNVTLTLETPLEYALPATASGSDTMWVTIWPNIYYDVRQSSGGAKFSVVGTTLVQVASGSYFWCQTWGPKFFQAGGTAPGRTDFYRTVVFAGDGSVLDASAGAVGHQRAGYILSQTTASDGDQFVMLQLSP